MTVGNLWGTISPLEDPENPASILREQGDFISSMTAQKIRGVVRFLNLPTGGATKYWGQQNPLLQFLDPPLPVNPQPTTNDFRASFALQVPALSDYRFVILEVTFPVLYYPLQLHKKVGLEQTVSCQDKSDFVRQLGLILKSAELMSVVGKLLTQVKIVEVNK